MANNKNDKLIDADGEDLQKSAGTATEPEEPIENSTTSDAIFNMELPPVSEVDSDYIKADEPANTSNGGESSQNSPGDDVPEFTEQDTQQAAEKLRGTKDDKGEPFDPSKHLFPPEKTPTGKWKKIPKAQQQKQSPEELADNSNTAIRLEAQKAAALYGTLHLGIFGAENGQPTDNAYKMMLVDSFENYMIENGVTKLPAGADALFSMGLYSLDVATKKPNSEKLKNWGGKFYGKLKGIFSRNKKVEEKEPEMKETPPNA